MPSHPQSYVTSEDNDNYMPTKYPLSPMANRCKIERHLADWFNVTSVGGALSGPGYLAHCRPHHFSDSQQTALVRLDGGVGAEILM